MTDPKITIRTNDQPIVGSNFLPIIRKNVTLKSRYFFAPINAGLADSYGNPTPELISFHAKRSGEEIGVNYLGNVSIHKDYVTNDTTLFVSENMDNWQGMTQLISNLGSLPGVQVACYKSNYKLIRKWKNKDDNAYIQFAQEEINALSIKEINTLVHQFVDSAVRLIDLGFKVIQIHAGHGYFLSTFTSPLFNKRSDEYGKDTMLVLKRIFEGIRTKAGSQDYILDLRISIYERSLDEDTQAKIESIENLYSHGALDMLSQTNGLYNLSKRLMYPHKSFGHCFMKQPIAQLANRFPNFIWNLCGNIWDLDDIEQSDIPRNLTFSIGRSLLADDDFISKNLDQKKDQVNRCNFCNKCHYYSMGLPNIACGVNPNLF